MKFPLSPLLAAAGLVLLAGCTLPTDTPAPSSPVVANAPKPLFRDPVFDGAADPSIIYSRAEKKWLMFYTNRRANVPGLTTVTWVHGTPIGVAESVDGANWKYRGTVDFPKDIPGTNVEIPTFWAPALVYDQGVYHMYVVIVPGVFTDWNHPRNIVHVTSRDLKTWKYEGTLPLVTDKVIDPCVLHLPDGTWRMWYNNERTGKTTYYADSPDLYHWTDKGSANLPRDRGEAPLAFFWKGHYWLLIDLLGNTGLGAYRSDDALKWERQPASLLDKPGTGKDDQNGGHHPEVVISGDRAFLYYFVHPGVAADSDARDSKRSSIQVTELKYADGWLTCDRDAVTSVSLTPAEDGKK
ncbi:MAG TPA: family 43 glycosylhydrolase [Opitutaceae bacterium]|nr:family 43 glycosylhydrolase [Opitutaceae bacterium]